MYQKASTNDTLVNTKMKHRDQLAQLLVHKFRNRFGITAEDKKIENEIVKEVTTLLNQGTATEQGLLRIE
jgi:hypothetical protein